MPMIMSEVFSGFLQEAAIYTIWAKDCLQTSTSMNAPPSAISQQSINEEIVEMEGLCREQWDYQQTGYGTGAGFDGEWIMIPDAGLPVTLGLGLIVVPVV
jgi:hypothetical protein